MYPREPEVFYMEGYTAARISIEPWSFFRVSDALEMFEKEISEAATYKTVVIGEFEYRVVKEPDGYFSILCVSV